MPQKQQDRELMAPLLHELRQRYGDLPNTVIAQLSGVPSWQVGKILRENVDGPAFTTIVRMCLGTNPPLSPNEAARIMHFEVPLENAHVSAEEAQFLTLLHHPSLSPEDRKDILRLLQMQVQVLANRAAIRAELEQAIAAGGALPPPETPPAP